MTHTSTPRLVWVPWHNYALVLWEMRDEDGYVGVCLSTEVPERCQSGYKSLEHAAELLEFKP